MRTHTRSWQQAIDEGHNPSWYEGYDVPKGPWTGRLDVKIWTKSGAGLACFFTRDEDGADEAAPAERYRLAAFRPRDTGPGSNPYWYTPQDGGIDFSDDAAAPGDRFRIEAGRTGRGSVKWISAERASGPVS